LKPSEQPEQRLFTVEETAQALGLSAKTVWNHTEPRGPIRCVRIGRSVRYYLPEVLNSLLGGRPSAGARF
jgi:predicted DNA-binding transcriptional regulator AlpA